MNYSRELEIIYNHLNREENSQKYHALINHPSEIDGGHKFLNNYDRAYELRNTPERTEIENLELESLIKYLNQWLNTNNWT